MLPPLVVAAAVVLIALRYDTRVVLLGAGLVLAALAGRPLLVLDTFGRAMVAPMVAPICASMGFAAVLRATGCDRQLVRLMLAPVRRAGVLTAPAGIAVAYLVNLAVTSQASVAAMMGPILLPLLRAAGLSDRRAAAALLLGASFGGDLLSPVAQDVLALAGATGVRPDLLNARLLPAGLAGLAVAAVSLGLWPSRGEGRKHGVGAEPADEGRIDLARAAIPVVPVTLLLLAYTGWGPLRWLLTVEDPAIPPALAAALPAVRALLIGVGLAALVGWRDLKANAAAFFRGMGAGYAEIISLTIVAQCFGAGVTASGLGDSILRAVGGTGAGLAGLSLAMPWGLAVLSGSGSGPVLAFAQACLAPLAGHPALPDLGALACLGAAFGRTMSPVSAVAICVAGLAGMPPVAVIRALLPSLLIGAGVAATAVLLIG